MSAPSGNNKYNNNPYLKSDDTETTEHKQELEEPEEYEYRIIGIIHNTIESVTEHLQSFNIQFIPNSLRVYKNSSVFGTTYPIADDFLQDVCFLFYLFILFILSRNKSNIMTQINQLAIDGVRVQINRIYDNTVNPDVYSVNKRWETLPEHKKIEYIKTRDIRLSHKHEALFMMLHFYIIFNKIKQRYPALVLEILKKFLARSINILKIIRLDPKFKNEEAYIRATNMYYVVLFCCGKLDEPKLILDKYEDVYNAAWSNVMSPIAPALVKKLKNVLRFLKKNDVVYSKALKALCFYSPLFIDYIETRETLVSVINNLKYHSKMTPLAIESIKNKLKAMDLSHRLLFDDVDEDIDDEDVPTPGFVDPMEYLHGDADNNQSKKPRKKWLELIEDESDEELSAEIKQLKKKKSIVIKSIKSNAKKLETYTKAAAKVKQHLAQLMNDLKILETDINALNAKESKHLYHIMESVDNLNINIEHVEDDDQSDQSDQSEHKDYISEKNQPVEESKDNQSKDNESEDKDKNIVDVE